MQLNRYLIRPAIQRALDEELYPGDTTGGFLVDDQQPGEAQIYVKEAGVVCGLLMVDETVKTLDADAEITWLVADGDEVQPGDVLLRIQTKAWVLFAIERVALDWIQYLSGIATKTRRYVKLIEPYGTRITDTRKGVPGIRLLQKYAVRVGGAHNHIFGLHNAILVKDNHIKAAGSITQAVETLRHNAQHTFKIEIECESLEQVREALTAGADIIMLDNMTLDDMKEGLRIVDGRAMTEASGGIIEETIIPIAETGVDIISVGALTHSVTAIDVSMDMGEIKTSARRVIAERRSAAD